MHLQITVYTHVFLFYMNGFCSGTVRLVVGKKGFLQLTLNPCIVKDVDVLLGEDFFWIYFWGGVECVGHSLPYVAHLVFLRDVGIRTARELP
jgi:hypothetical protein